MTVVANEATATGIDQDQLKRLFETSQPLGHQTPIGLRNGIQLSPSQLSCPCCNDAVPLARIRAKVVKQNNGKVVRCFMFSYCDQCSTYAASAEAYVASSFSAQLCMLIGDTWSPYCEVKLPLMSCLRHAGKALVHKLQDKLQRSNSMTGNAERC